MNVLLKDNTLRIWHSQVFTADLVAQLQVQLMQLNFGQWTSKP